MTDLDRQLNEVLPEPNPFAMTVDDLFAYWQATVDHLYRLLKGKRKAELKGKPWKGWNAAGLHDPSASIGRLEACEMLLPGLRELWHTGRHSELTTLRIVDAHAREDAEEEFRNEILLGALATGEVEAPAEREAA